MLYFHYFSLFSIVQFVSVTFMTMYNCECETFTSMTHFTLTEFLDVNTGSI